MDSIRQRMIAVVERLAENLPALPRRLRHPLSLDRIGRERLLAQHVLARSQRRNRPFAVQRIRQRIVDNVEAGIIDKIVVGRDHSRDPVSVGEFARPLRIARRDRDYFSLGHILRRLNQCVRRNPRRTKNSKPKWTLFCHRTILQPAIGLMPCGPLVQRFLRRHLVVVRPLPFARSRNGMARWRS